MTALLDIEGELILERDGIEALRIEVEERGERHPATLCRGSLEEYQLQERILNEHEIEVVFHLGAQTIVPTANRAPLSTFGANVSRSLSTISEISGWASASPSASSPPPSTC